MISPLSEVESPFRSPYAQLHFSQTQHLFFATHQGGEFHTVTKANIRDASNAASAIGRKLSKLHDALKSIQEVVNNSGLEGRLSLVGGCDGPLFWRLVGGSRLSLFVVPSSNFWKSRKRFQPKSMVEHCNPNSLER